MIAVDEHRLMPRWRAGAERDLRKREQARIAADIVRAEERPLSEAKASNEAGGDPWQLRGIPAIGRGAAGGAIAGTSPEHEIERLDE